jgi:hypothetical protein
MYLYLILTFLALVTYQTIAKKQQLPLISNGLIRVKDNAIIFFEWLGEIAGKWLNVYDWITKFFRRLWELVEKLWDGIRPFFESMLEILQPLWQLLFSWVYFFVGFAKSHYLIFSYIGGGIVLGGLIWWFQIPILQIIMSKYFVTTTCVTLGAIGIAYPNILPQLFPRCTEIWREIRTTPPERNVDIEGVIHTYNTLMLFRAEELRELLRDRQLSDRGTKPELANRLLDMN